jgi:hypothetical protein
MRRPSRTARTLALIVLSVVLIAGLMVLRVRWSFQSVPWSIVTSPSGKSVAFKTYEPTGWADYYGLIIVTEDRFFGRIMPILTERTPHLVMGQDGAMLAWNDENHLTVGWPNGMKMPFGPRIVAGIDINYITYEPDLDRVSWTKALRANLREVSYHAEEIDGPSRGQKQCSIHITGTDGEYFDRLSVDLIASGFGPPGYMGLLSNGVTIKFILSALRNSSALSLTHAKLGPTPQNDLFFPRQSDLSLTFIGYRPDEIRQAFSAIRGGDFDIKLGFNFEELSIIYRVARRIDEDVMRRFNACASKTNIQGSPF